RAFTDSGLRGDVAVFADASCGRNAVIELLPKRGRPPTHGHTIGYKDSATYRSWQAMLSRVRYVDRDIDLKHAARGISMCDRWNSFENFLADMGERPSGMTLDRYPNNDGNYEPSNCRWATPVDQARNRRNTRLTLEAATEIAVRRLRGESAKALAIEFGISESLPREIVKGRSWKDALVAAKEIIGATS
ncbi:MAG TPA: hypothetical protein VFR76_02020, partial [Verrucomicrobiae bacterium]|nr:hypothetical protein [Verrucomicrobiae bacterium]